MLGLKSFEKLRTKEEFAAFELDWMEIFNEKFCKSLQTRTMNLLPVILENAKTFSDAAAHHIGNRRIGDQVGSMLAGAYSLSSSKKISYDEALEWVKKRDWTEEKGLELTKDEYQLLNIIMGYVVKLESDFGTVERSIGEIILIATGKTQDMRVIQPVADARLKRLGIMISKDLLIFSNTSTAIKHMLKIAIWVLLNSESGYIARLLFDNIRRNARIGINDVETELKAKVIQNE
jgi:putative DNA primase/helicase